MNDRFESLTGELVCRSQRSPANALNRRPICLFHATLTSFLHLSYLQMTICLVPSTWIGIRLNSRSSLYQIRCVETLASTTLGPQIWVRRDSSDTRNLHPSNLSWQRRLHSSSWSWPCLSRNLRRTLRCQPRCRSWSFRCSHLEIQIGSLLSVHLQDILEIKSWKVVCGSKVWKTNNSLASAQEVVD